MWLISHSDHKAKQPSASLCKVLALSWDGEGELPCREKEILAIARFLEGVKAGQGGAMYLSGVPGTGKTASVNFALKSLGEEVS